MKKEVLFIAILSVLLLDFTPVWGQQRPNVVLITTDDLRWDLPGFAGGKAKTPNLDELRESSVYFENAMTTTGLCSPSRAALYTGRWGHRTGVDDNVRMWHSKNTGIPADKSTLMEWARQSGYFTGYVGKWHLGEFGPFKRGIHRSNFNYSPRGEHGISQGRPDYERIDKYYRTDTTFQEKSRYYEIRGETYADSREPQRVNQGIAFLKEAANQSNNPFPQFNKPFFLSFNFHGPHPPYRPPAEFANMYDYRDMELPESLNDPYKNKPIYQKDDWWPWHDTGHMSDKDWRKTMAYALATVSVIDRGVGLLMDTLKEKGLWENTIVIFVSDQGSMIGEHGLYDKAPYSYDELMRIPLLIRIPGTESKTISRQVSLIDIPKTLVELMDLDPSDPPLDSRSLLPLIKKGDDGWSGPDEVFYTYEWYNGGWFGVRTIRTPELKYCWNPTGLDELYDLQKDPHEITNLANNPNYHSDKRHLQNRLLKHLKETQDPLHDDMKKYVERQNN